MSEINMTWLESGPTLCRVVARNHDTQALTVQNGYKKTLAKPQQYYSMIDPNQGVQLVGSE
jgi:hypothetical protein